MLVLLWHWTAPLTPAHIFSLCLQFGFLYLTATVVFDVIHWLLHYFERQKHPFLRWLGSLHGVHHLYLSKELKFVPKWRQQNLVFHLAPERLTQIAVALAGLCFFSPFVVTVLVIVFFIQFLVLAFNGGRDPVHKELSRMPAPKGGAWTDLGYHSLHHVYPYSYYSSVIRVFDTLFGTAVERNRKTAVVDSTGLIAPWFQKKLPDALHGIDTADVLILVDLDSSQLETARKFQASKTGLLPAEVWLCTNKPEVSVDLVCDSDLIFRRISGWSQNPQETEAEVDRALFWITRGFDSIPLQKFGRAFLAARVPRLRRSRL